MTNTCVLCDNERAGSRAKGQYGVHVDGQWIERFVDRQPGATDKEWEAVAGLTLASRAKAIPGEKPYLWAYADSARFVANVLGGTIDWICAECMPIDGKQHAERPRGKTKKKAAEPTEDD